MTATNTKNVMVIGKIHPAGQDLLEARADVTVTHASPDDPNLADQVADVDGILLRIYPIDRRLIDNAPKLVIVARHGVGYDTVDLDALTARGIPLAVVGEANSPTVAEHALYLLLTVAKQGAAYDRAMRDDDWAFRETLAATELGAKTLLVIGFGRIGTRVARLGQAFGMDVQVLDPYVADDAIEAAGCTPVAALGPALPEADFVTVHTPLNDETRHMIGAAELAAMKSSAALVNTARGGVIDEPALLAALRDGAIRGAGLDVFDREPPDADNPLFRLDNVVLSPHIAGITAECMVRMSRTCAENVLGAFDGTLNPDNVVNKEVLTAR